MKISKKWNKTLDISSFYTSAPKILIMHYTVSEIWHVTDVSVIFHLGLFFALLPHPTPHPPEQPKKSKFEKNDKKTWIYHHFTHVYQKLWLDDVWFLRYGVQWTDGQMDRQKKWHIEVGAPPKNLCSSYYFRSSLVFSRDAVSWHSLCYMLEENSCHVFQWIQKAAESGNMWWCL